MLELLEFQVPEAELHLVQHKDSAVKPGWVDPLQTGWLDSKD